MCVTWTAHLPDAGPAEQKPEPPRTGNLRSSAGIASRPQALTMDQSFSGHTACNFRWLRLKTMIGRLLSLAE